jgi:hypothetical protein
VKRLTAEELSRLVHAIESETGGLQRHEQAYLRLPPTREEWLLDAKHTGIDWAHHDALRARAQLVAQTQGDEPVVVRTNTVSLNGFLPEYIATLDRLEPYRKLPT